jgi:Glyoxalase/Bleomycin resistance protein/Dioxygenase superfamily
MLEELEGMLRVIAILENTMAARLEHLNLTASDPDALAGLLCRLFGWTIRWQGSAIHGGRTIHVGGPDTYMAIYSGRPGAILATSGESHATRNGLNHIGVVVEDLDVVEAKARAEGFSPHSHDDYEPGRRFYFDGPDDLEIEVVSYRKE